MRYRTFGRTGWQVSEIGYGMWGMAGWTGSSDEESLDSLDRAIALGCNFFDTAYAYGGGHSERLLGRVLRKHQGKQLYAATKIPPKNQQWPGKAHYEIRDVFPPDHIAEYTRRSLENVGVDTIDLIQFHVWNDAWANDDGWKRAVERLKKDGLIRAFGISVNRWQPANVLRALDTGLVDAVQVVYNLFDQNPEDELFPYCREHEIAIIARVPFDEGSLTGTLTADSRWPEGDFRNIYFRPDNLHPTLERVERLRTVVPPGMNLPELALRFILESPDVSTIIPGMRRLTNVEANMAAAGREPLDTKLMAELGRHRWDRHTDYE